MKLKSLEYAEKVVTGGLVAPSQPMQQCKNFLKEYNELQHQDDYPFFFNEKTAVKIRKIANIFNFGSGFLEGQPIGSNLKLYQWFIIENIFCWEYKEFKGRRKIREVAISIARKNSKSILSVLIHLIALILDGKNQTHFVGAGSLKQANIILDEMKFIIESTPDMKPFFVCVANKITFTKSNSRIEALPANGRKLDGRQAKIATIDEVGSDEKISLVITSLRNSQSTARNPLVFMISTSYEIQNAYNSWQKRLETMTENTFNENADAFSWGLTYNIDNAKKEESIDGVLKPKWHNPNTWLYPNPFMAEEPSMLERFHEDFVIAQATEEDFHEFSIKRLNVWQPALNLDEEMFITEDKLERNKDESITWDFFRGKMVVIGLDVAMKNDNLSFVFMTYENGKTYVRDIVFYPKAEEANKLKSEGLHYAEFTTQGFCEPFGNETVDTKNLGQHVYENYIKKYDMQLGTVLFDQKYAEDIIEYFEQEVGMEVSPIMVQQNSFTLGPVISDFQQEIIDQDVLYYPNPLTTSAYINSVVRYPKGKPYIIKPEKGKVKNKVDSMFASLNAFFGVRYFRKRDLFNGGKSYVYSRGDN